MKAKEKYAEAMNQLPGKWSGSRSFESVVGNECMEAKEKFGFYPALGVEVGIGRLKEMGLSQPR